MIELIKNNQKFLESLPLFFKDQKKQDEIIKKLNSDKLIVISGITGTLKTSIVNNIIQKSNYKNNYFYFNKDLDYKNEIKNKEKLFLLFQTYTNRYNKPSIIILENINNIDGFKEFLADLYTQNFKIIIIANNIKIGGKPEIKVSGLNISQIIEIQKENFNLNDILKYGSLANTLILTNTYLKENFLNLQKNEIIFNDIVKGYSLKSYDLYIFTITFLSFLNKYTSLREFNKEINNHIKISLVTTIEYIDYSIEANIINRMYAYDIKRQKEVNTKAKYYFTDLGIRNSLNGFTTDKLSLKENLIYNELIKKGYSVTGGINGIFNFSFIGALSANKIYIHLSTQNSREEIKKEARKLLKINDSFSKYLIVENIKQMGIKKTKYDSVEILEFEEFVKRVLA